MSDNSFIRSIHMNIEKRKKAGIILIVLLSAMAAGLGGGRLAGHVMLKNFVLNRSFLSVFLVRPVADYRYVMDLLSSDNEMDRLAGYYSLTSYGIADEKFLSERFKRESGEYIKRSIIWILSRDINSKVIQFYNNIYDESSRNVRKEIIKALYRYDEHVFSSFVDTHSVPIEFIHEATGEESL